MNENLFEVLRGFHLDAEPVSCEPYGCGHINVTYLAVTESGRRYILQKINSNTFRDVAGLMENITAVTEFLRTKTDDPRGVLTLVKTHDSASYLHAQDAYWRTYDFVEDSICLQLPETDEDFYQSAVGFGTFQQLLTDFPAAKLHETIPNFHNTPDRYRALLETLERDPMHRAAQVQPEIEFALARQAEMSAIQNALTAGELPLRVTHNDTKLNKAKPSNTFSVSVMLCLLSFFVSGRKKTATAKRQLVSHAICICDGMGDFQLCRQLPTQLIEHADLLLAVCDIQSHLTGSVRAAILSAQNRSIPVTMICPDTAEISRLKDGAPNPEIV